MFFLFFVNQVSKILHNSLFTFLLSNERQAKTENMEMKISQPIFGTLVALMKNEDMEICYEPGIIYYLCICLKVAKWVFMTW